ncbi:hypothetical protein ACFL2O_02290 [Thermodesulfobacteriota bacterium]
MIIKRLIIWSIIGTGITTVTTQLLTVREFLTQFHGNEITISLVLFCWLLLTGFGSFSVKVIKKSSITSYSILIFIIAIWPLIQVVGIRILRETMFVHGVSPGFYSIFLYIFLSTFFYCLLAGFILPYALQVMRGNNYPFETGDLYLTDNIGDIVGGFLFSFVLVFWLKPFAIIAVTSISLIVISLLLFIRIRKYIFVFSVLIMGGAFLYFSCDKTFEMKTLEGQYGNIAKYKESPYGRIIITKEGEQHTVWESGLPLYSDGNIVESEERVHYPLSQLDHVEKILLISGGLGETLYEILKYDPELVEYVELDPVLTKEAFQLGMINKSPNVKILNRDGRKHVSSTTEKYDAVIIALPEPGTFQLNRFFTLEFFSLIKRVLKQDGVLSMGFDYSQNYVSEIQRRKLSIISNTAGFYFKNTLIIPGEKAYMLFSDKKLERDILGRLKKKSIQTTYIEAFFSGNITEEKIININNSLYEWELENTDFKPRLMNIIFQEWFKKHGSYSIYLLVMLPAFMVVCLILMRKEQFAIFTTGVASLGAEMLVIFSFQVIYGYVYQEIGAIVTAFLFGLLPGAALGKIWSRSESRKLFISEILLIMMLLVFSLWIQYQGKLVPRILFLIYCFIFSFISGFQFPVAARIIGEKKRPAAVLFSSDLCGASIGTIATGTILIPLSGMTSAAVFLILVKMSSLTRLIIKKGAG